MYNSEEKKLADVYQNVILKGNDNKEDKTTVFERQRSEKAAQLEAYKQSKENDILDFLDNSKEK